MRLTAADMIAAMTTDLTMIFFIFASRLSFSTKDMKHIGKVAATCPAVNEQPTYWPVWSQYVGCLGANFCLLQPHHLSCHPVSRFHCPDQDVSRTLKPKKATARSDGHCIYFIFILQRTAQYPSIRH